MIKPNIKSWEKHVLIQTLIQITGRSEEELELLLTKLTESDVRKISNLCTNYTRIEKYCRLILTSPKDFRSEVEKELGKEAYRQPSSNWQRYPFEKWQNILRISLMESRTA